MNLVELGGQLVKKLSLKLVDECTLDQLAHGQITVYCEFLGVFPYFRINTYAENVSLLHQITCSSIVVKYYKTVVITNVVL